MKKMYTKVLKTIAKMAQQACYDSSGTASRASVCEPEIPVEVQKWRETHESLLEKISKKPAR